MKMGLGGAKGRGGLSQGSQGSAWVSGGAGGSGLAKPGGAWVCRAPERDRATRALGLAALLAATACSSAPPPNAKTPAGERRDTAIVHEPCDVSGAGAVAEDVSGDKRADLVIVKNGQTELCRSVDLNFDGKVDIWIYRDAAGAVRRRESDFDRDGRIDEIALYRGGELFERHRATTLRGRLDTWQYYEKGKIVRAVRDSDGDTAIDEWWEYSVKGKPGCPLVHSDADHDGRPDPGSTVNLCSDELAANMPDESHDEPTSPLKPREAMPVELNPGAAPASTETSSAPAGAKP